MTDPTQLKSPPRYAWVLFLPFWLLLLFAVVAAVSWVWL